MRINYFVFHKVCRKCMWLPLWKVLLENNTVTSGNSLKKIYERYAI